MLINCIYVIYAGSSPDLQNYDKMKAKHQIHLGLYVHSEFVVNVAENALVASDPPHSTLEWARCHQKENYKHKK